MSFIAKYWVSFECNPPLKMDQLNMQINTLQKSSYKWSVWTVNDNALDYCGYELFT